MAVLSDEPPGAVPPEVGAALAAAFEQEWPRVVATLIRVTGDWSMAEDATQDAFAAAARRWPSDGVPDRPGAWLTTAARNAALDRLRKRRTEERTLMSSTPVSEAHDPIGDALAALGEADIPDDRLRLIFTCCHPALPPEARVALTLRTLGGLEVDEIAAAFAVGEHAMAKRLVRARGKIAHARIPYRVPAAADLPERLDAVLAVVYLIFTEGYAPTSGDVVRVDLCAQALRLGEALGQLLPGDGEVWGLLALMRLHHSRRAARADDGGVPVPIDEQDRTRWDRTAIGGGLDALSRGRAAATEGHGPYLLQAEIAACHAADGGTDWSRIVMLYDGLLTVSPTPHVRLARAVAVGRARGADAGLAALSALVGEGLPAHLVPAARADLLRRARRSAEAARAFREALALAPDGPQRRFLELRLAQLTGSRAAGASAAE